MENDKSASKTVPELPPRPWRVYRSKLRQNYALPIIEIHDSNGRTVIPWSGFDGCDIKPAVLASIARAIVKSVNKVMP